MVDRVIAIPRVLRAKDAPAYVGLDRRRFNREVRPYLTVIREPGRRAVRFDRLELDQYVEYILAQAAPPERVPPWRTSEPKEGDRAALAPTAKARAQAILRKRTGKETT